MCVIQRSVALAERRRNLISVVRSAVLVAVFIARLVYGNEIATSAYGLLAMTQWGMV